jgi:hypothetical protein
VSAAPRARARASWRSGAGATLAALTLAGAGVIAACGTKDDGPPPLSGEALMNPETCRSCHEEHFRQWSGSMHAYAGEDPVFIAMNKRMQRETNGAAGSLCVGCHAPLAVRMGRTTDGLNLAELPAYMRGVTCYFCHSTDAVEGTHNNPLRLATDGALRGPFANPAKAAPHKSVYSDLHDREKAASSTLCGACHDVVTPAGAHIERTFTEWQGSVYAGAGKLSCGKCHMDGRDGLAAPGVAGVGVRVVHDHGFPAVDVALTPFPEAEAQRRAVQAFLDQTLIAKLCVRQLPTGVVAEVTLDNAFAGHKFPSGANQDRRAWVELVAFRGGAEVFVSGRVPDGKAAASIGDPNLWLLRDKIFDVAGKETHMFWEAARFEAEQLPAAITNDPQAPGFVHSVTRTYPLPSPAPDRVTMRVRMRPLDFELLDDLVASGDLDREIAARVPTFDLASANKEWTAASLGFTRCAE